MSLVLQKLIDADVITTDDAATVEEYVAERQVSISNAVVTLGLATKDKVKEVLLQATSDIPYVRNLADVRCDPDAIARVPRAKARRLRVVPLVYEGSDLILVTTVDQYRSTALAEDLRHMLGGRPYRLRVASDADVAAKLDAEYRNEIELTNLAERVSEGEGESDAAVQMVELTLEQAIRDGASDIHVEPARSEVRVRYRIDGVLVEKPVFPKAIQEGIVSRLKILADIDIAEKRRPQDGRLTRTATDGKKIDMRVSTLPTKHGEKVVLRILDNSNTRRSLADFAFSTANQDRWMSAARKPSGLLLVTGPTGSGKSTTLYATLNELAHPGVNIVTVEDPVEYEIAGINQVQVNTKAGLTFATALRSILRQDPDIVLVGEIRDAETARIAIEASLTGHLVLSTLHTNSAPEAATRLGEMGVERFLIGSVLECVMAQRLVRRLCERCKTPHTPDPDELAAVGFDVPVEQGRFFQANGCAACAQTGYRGRVAVHETMVRTPALEKLIVRDESVDELTAQAHRDGMAPMRSDGWSKVAAGLTTMSEVLRVVA